MRLNQLLLLCLSLACLSVLSVSAQNKTGGNKIHSNLQELLPNFRSSKTIKNSFVDQRIIKKKDNVLLEITATQNVEITKVAIENLGIEIKATAGRKISAWVSLNQLEALSNLQEVRWVKGVSQTSAFSNIGSAETTSVEQDGFANIFETYGILGEGVTIGVISTSYNNANGEAAGINSGDLPGPGNPNGFTKPVIILDESDVSDDEGRALIEIMHDLAPAADYVYATGFNGVVSYADNVQNLVDAGVDLIVSDINYFDSPFYLDGVVARAFDAAYLQGVPVIQAAGNLRTNAYESQFRNSGTFYRNEIAHDFDPGPGLDITQTISIPNGNAKIALQWDDSWFSQGGVGTNTDFSVHFLNEAGEYLATVSDDNLQSGDPSQFVSITDLEITTLQMIFTKKVGPDPNLIKYLATANVSIDEWATNSPTILGDFNSEFLISVGGNAQSNPTQRYFFSSLGGAQLLFDVEGNRLAEPIIRNLPTLTATQGTNTTFFGFTNAIDDVEGDGLPNFYGTSASAAHVAGLVALMLECNSAYTPAEIEELLVDTARDFEAPGFDFFTGNGYWNPEQVLENCVNENPIDPVDPIDPIDPVDPVDPVDPDDPVDPVDPYDFVYEFDFEFDFENEFDFEFDFEDEFDFDFDFEDEFDFDFDIDFENDYDFENDFYYENDYVNDFDCFYHPENCKTENLSLKADIQVYPNPATSKIYIAANNLKLTNIKMYSAIGSLVKQISFDALTANKNSISINDLKSGVYYLQLIDGDQIFSAKFIKK